MHSGHHETEDSKMDHAALMVFAGFTVAMALFATLIGYLLYDERRKPL